MKMHKIILIVGFFYLVGQACAMEQKAKIGALEEKKAMAAVAEGAGDAKQSVAAAASAAKPTTLLDTLEADPSLRKAGIPSTVLALMDEYADTDIADSLSALFKRHSIKLKDFYSTVGIMLPSKGLVLFSQDNRYLEDLQQLQRRLIFVDCPEESGGKRETYALNYVWPFINNADCIAVSLGVTPDGKFLVMVAREYHRTADTSRTIQYKGEMSARQTFDFEYEIALWDLKANTIAKIITQKELQALNGLEFGGVLTVLSNGLVALQDKKDAGAVVLYDLVANQVIGRLAGHTAQLRAIKLVNVATLITGTADGTIRVWDIQNREKLTCNTYNEKLAEEIEASADFRTFLGEADCDVIPYERSLYFYRPTKAIADKVTGKTNYPVAAITSKVLLVPGQDRVQVYTFDAEALQELQNLSLQQRDALKELISLTGRGKRHHATAAMVEGRNKRKAELIAQLPSALTKNI